MKYVLLASTKDEASATEMIASRRKSAEFLTEVATLCGGVLIVVSTRTLKSLSHNCANDVILSVILLFFVVVFNNGLMVMGLYNIGVMVYHVLCQRYQSVFSWA